MMRSFIQRKRKNLACIPFLLLFFSLIVTQAHAETPAIKASPEFQQVDIGVTFTVNVTAENWLSPGIWGYELIVYYNTTILDAIEAEIPTGHFLTPTIKPSNIFIVDSGTIYDNEGYVSFAAVLLAPEPGKTGSGTLVSIKFNGTAEGVSLLDVGDVILVDPSAIEIPSNTYNVTDDDVTVVPEFPAILLIPLFLALTLVAIIMGKTHWSKKHWSPAVAK